jgi:hypothetical protein
LWESDKSSTVHHVRMQGVRSWSLDRRTQPNPDHGRSDRLVCRWRATNLVCLFSDRTQDATQGGPSCQQKALGRFSERRDFLRESGEDILCRVSRVAVRMPGTTSKHYVLEITSCASQWLHSGASLYLTECQADVLCTASRVSVQTKQKCCLVAFSPSRFLS